jgi:hypothetical protein
MPQLIIGGWEVREPAQKDLLVLTRIPTGFVMSGHSAWPQAQRRDLEKDHAVPWCAGRDGARGDGHQRGAGFGRHPSERQNEGGVAGGYSACSGSERRLLPGFVPLLAVARRYVRDRTKDSFSTGAATCISQAHRTSDSW